LKNYSIAYIRKEAQSSSFTKVCERSLYHNSLLFWFRVFVLINIVTKSIAQ
jgi:hypothetical protein